MDCHASRFEVVHADLHAARRVTTALSPARILSKKVLTVSMHKTQHSSLMMINILWPLLPLRVLPSRASLWHNDLYCRIHQDPYRVMQLLRHSANTKCRWYTPLTHCSVALRNQTRNENNHNNSPVGDLVGLAVGKRVGGGAVGKCVGTTAAPMKTKRA